MADLKRLDADGLTEGVRRAAERGKASVDAYARDALVAIQEAARVLPVLPGRAADLLATAKLAYVHEFEQRQPARYFQATLTFDAVHTVIGDEHRPDQTVLPPGRYRALLFVLPIGEVGDKATG